MDEFTLNKIVVEPLMQKFLDEINSQDTTPICELTPAEARKVLLKVQDVLTEILPADVEDTKIPVGPKGETNIRIVRPKGNNSKLHIIFYFHGGGWILGDKHTHNRLIREIANKAQAAVVLIDFSRSPENQYPIAIEESYETIKYISENDKTFNLDATKLVVAGDSVGGNMATVLAMLAKERSGPQIDYQFLFYPVTDANFETKSYKKFSDGYWLSTNAMKWFWNAYLPNKEERKKYTVSPLQASLEQLKGLPPALIITNEDDVLRDEGEAYAHKLMEAGVNVTAIRLLGTIHDCLLLNPIASAQIIRDIIRFISCKINEIFNV